VLRTYIHRSLLIKKRIIELDEFDKGPRNVMNYGHSFGHAVESATEFGIPHGIAVTIGMDMANFVAAGLRISTGAHYEAMHPVLARNYAGFESTEIPLPSFLCALGRDKKNVGADLTLVVPDMAGVIGLRRVTPDKEFQHLCEAFLSTKRGQ